MFRCEAMCQRVHVLVPCHLYITSCMCSCVHCYPDQRLDEVLDWDSTYVPWVVVAIIVAVPIAAMPRPCCAQHLSAYCASVEARERACVYVRMCVCMCECRGPPVVLMSRSALACACTHVSTGLLIGQSGLEICTETAATIGRKSPDEPAVVLSSFEFHTQMLIPVEPSPSTISGPRRCPRALCRARRRLAMAQWNERSEQWIVVRGSWCVSDSPDCCRTTA